MVKNIKYARAVKVKLRPKERLVGFTSRKPLGSSSKAGV